MSKHPDPLVLLEEFEHPGSTRTSFFRLADRLLSIVANSATCERLFSVFGMTLTKLRNRLGTSTLSSLAELKMHIRGEHQENSTTKTRMKNMFDHRSKTHPHSTPQQPPQADPNPAQAEPDTNDSDVEMSSTSDSASASTSDPSLRHLIPTEATDSEPRNLETGSSVSLQDLFNFDECSWTNIYGEYAKRHLADELEVCELLNKDAATENSLEVDVDEMTGDILMG